MTIPSFESAFGRSLVFLCFFIALPTQAYTEQELKAFAKLEQKMTQQPEAAKTWPTDDIQNKAQAYREEALTLSR
ncbi:type-F conjugative transfer system pilin assembly protein TrbC, partial [Vibrio atlanticus]